VLYAEYFTQTAFIVCNRQYSVGKLRSTSLPLADGLKLQGVEKARLLEKAISVKKFNERPQYNALESWSKRCPNTEGWQNAIGLYGSYHPL
jgi:hypothetical protein